MNGARAPFLLALLVLAAPSRAARDESKDAPAAAPAPPIFAWRLPPAAPRPALRLEEGVDLLEPARAELSAAPAGRARGEVEAALDDLERGADRLPLEARRAWLDAHLGSLNETVRGLPEDAPAPTVFRAARGAARLDARAERWADARAMADRALAAAPGDAEALVLRSRASAGLGDLAGAYADADRAVRAAPGLAAARTARAAASYGLGEYPPAAADARRALALDPEDKTAFALMKLSEGRERRAPGFEGVAGPRPADSVEREYHGMVQQLDEAAERGRVPPAAPDPDGSSRLAASAGSKLAVKDYWGALKDADKALELDPEDVRALYFRAAAHNLLGEYGEAARDATRGLTVSPSDPALHDARAWAYNRMGRRADAVADAHRALEADPRDAYAYANRAYAEEQAGDYEAMADDYRAAADLDARLEPAYQDAVRRHGLAPQSRRSKEAERARRRTRRLRGFAAVLASSLVGGLLIAFGVLHVGALKDRLAAPPAGGIEAGYSLGRAIGQGGMGVVYEAVDRKLRRPVAIKMLRDEFKLDDEAKEGFLAEARTVAELRHPSIVDIHAIVEDERGLYLVFERLEGRTLDAVLAERKRLPLREIKGVLRRVCEALEYAHGRDVVHRDLKPANVMLTDDGVKVLDFGISRHAARAGAAPVTDAVTGTPHYMAPEQEYGFVRKESDVFSLGAVLYEMATGVRPYEGSGDAKLAKAYLRASSRLPGVPRELDELIEGALEPDPAKRIASPAEFWRRLASVPDIVPTDA